MHSFSSPPCQTCIYYGQQDIPVDILIIGPVLCHCAHFAKGSCTDPFNLRPILLTCICAKY